MEWLKQLSKKERAGVVFTVVWAILVGLFAIEQWGEELQVFALFWGLPVVIAWGIYWVRRSPRKG